MLKAEIRDAKGKSACRNFRRDGLVPAVLYGRGEKPISLVIREREFSRLLEAIKGHSPIIEMELAQERVRCVIKLIQRHPISLRLLHVDFQKVQEKEKIQVAVPVILTGIDKSVGIKAGGILEHHLREIPLKACVDKIPEHIEIDLSNLKIGHSIHIADLKLPGVDFALPAATTVVSILAPRKVEEVVTPIVTEEAKEPEVITEKKREDEISEEDKEKRAQSEKAATAKKEKK